MKRGTLGRDNTRRTSEGGYGEGTRFTGRGRPWGDFFQLLDTSFHICKMEIIITLSLVSRSEHMYYSTQKSVPRKPAIEGAL